MARINHFLDPTDENRQSLEAVIRDMNKKNKPEKFSPGPGNVLVAHRGEFERNSAMIEKNFGGVRASSLTLREYISRLIQIKEDIKAQTKHAGLQMEVKPE